jgi:hypothetical protein
VKKAWLFEQPKISSVKKAAAVKKERQLEQPKFSAESCASEEGEEA